MATARVGTSGWQYDSWRPAFYPQGLGKSRWFGVYAGRFPTVEINYSFYRLPSERTVRAWHDAAPDRFRFAVKGSRYVTHNLKLAAGTPEAVDNVTRRLAPLGDHLGIWLWQLPPNLHRDDARLADFLAVLPRDRPHAVEFRHVSWFDDAVFALLDDHAAACVWLSDPELPEVCPVTSGPVYVRFHGRTTPRYHYAYSSAELAPWAERLRAAVDAGHDVWAFFNNDVGANAPRDATTLTHLLADVTVPW